MTVLELVRREQLRLRTRLAAAAVAGVLAAIAIALASGVVVLGGSRYIALPRFAPFVFWGVALISIAYGVRVLIRIRRADSNTQNVARAIERERALRDGALRGVLELRQDSPFTQRANAMLLSAIGGESVAVLAPRLQLAAGKRALMSLLGFGAGALIFFVAGREAPDGWRALLHPMSAWHGTLAEPIRIEAPSAVLRGEKVEVRIVAPERRRVTLLYRSTGSAWRQSDYPVAAGNHALALIGPVDADLILVAEDGRARSDTVTLRVTDRPYLGDVSLRAVYPAYLGRPAEVLPVGERMRLPRGTVVEVTGHASVELASAGLVHESGDTTQFDVRGHRFTGRLAPRSGGRWEWSAAGVSFPVAEVPPPVEIEVVPDSAPQLRILWPDADTVLSADRGIAMELSATDDHGLASVSLRSWRVRQGDSGRVERRVVVAQEPGAAWSGIAELNLPAMQLEPGDEVRVVLEGMDTSPWRQRSTSRELVIRIPTSSEQRALARDAAVEAVAEALAAAAAQRELERRTGELAQSRDRAASNAASGSGGSGSDAGSMSYEAAERARALAGAQGDMDARIEDLKKAAAQMEEELRRAGALDEDLAARIAEARSLIDQAMSPELRAHMRRLEEAAQQLSQDQARQSLQELQEQQRRLREQLQKSAEMLQRAAFEGAMQTLSDEARDISGRERSLADSLARGADAGRESRQLETLSAELKRDMEELAKRLAEAGAAAGAELSAQAAQQVKQAIEELQRLNNLTQVGQQTQGQQGRGQGQQTQQGQQAQQGQQTQLNAQRAQAASDAMDRAADQMARARSEQIGEWKSEITGELERAVQEMQQLAREQNRVAQQLTQGANPGDLRGDQSAIQQGVQRVNERLQQAAQKSSLLSQQSQNATGDAQNKVAQATEQLAGSQSTAQTAGAMRESASAMQQAATSLARDRERANSARSASGFTEMIEAMQQIAQQQGGLNTMSQGLMQNAAGMSPEDRAREAAAIARQQRELARRMEELADASGRSELLAAEARRIAAALEAGLVDQATVLRQQQLFRRLLDAGRTLEQGEPDSLGRRESRSATAGAVHTPQGSDGRGAPAVMYREPGWDELRGLTAEERRAVLDYFRRINGGGS